MANLDSRPTIDEVTLGDIPSVFFSEIGILSTDILEPMAKYYVMQAVAEFAERSRTQLRKVQVCTECGVESYKLDLPEGERFVSFQDSLGINSGVTNCGSYRYTWLASSEQIVSSPKPQRSECLEIVVATAPKLGSCEVDTRIIMDNYRTILHGVKSYLYAMKGENVTWGDGSLTTFHDQKFQAGIVSASIDKVVGHHSGPFKHNARGVV